MRIAIITQNYLPFTGGVETHIAKTAKALSLRHDVTVAAINFGYRRLPARLGVLAHNLLAPPAVAERLDGQVKVVSLSPSFFDRIKGLPLALRALPRVQRWFYEELNRSTHWSYRWAFDERLVCVIGEADIVHSMAFGDLGFAAQAVANRYGIPFVCTPFVHPGQWGDGCEDRKYYQRCDAIIALTPSDREYLASIGVPSKSLRVIGVAPDLSGERDGTGFRMRYDLGESPVILYVGRMMWKKGSRALIESAVRVWQAIPDAQFVFIGPNDSPDLRMFEGKDSRIRYLGVVSKQEKADAFEACDILCVPSISEILPTVYLEAWMCKKPVIAGCAPGLYDLVEGNRAGLCVPQEEDRIATEIVRLLKASSLRQTMGENGSNLVARSYSADRIAIQHEELYEELYCAKREAAVQRKCQ